MINTLETAALSGQEGHGLYMLLAYLSTAIRELEAARAIVVAELEGRVSS